MIVRTGLVGEVENPLDHVALDGMDHSQSGALRDEVVNVFFGHVAFETRAKMQQSEEEAGRGVEQPDHRRGRPRHPRKRPSDANRNRFRVVQGDMLGRQFADDERGVGHCDRHHDNGKRLAIGCQERSEAQEFLEPFGERGAAENSRQRRGGGKADLNGSQHARRIVGKREGNLRSRPPFLGQAFQVRAA